MRVLVLGGTAFIGPALVRELSGRGHELAVFHRGKTSASLPSGVTVLRGDRHQLGEHVAVLRGLKPDVVVDMIAFTRHDAQDLVEVFAGYAGRTVVASSGDVYRNFGGLIGTETTAPAAGPLSEAAPVRLKRYPFRAQAKGPQDFMYEYDKLDVEEVLAEAQPRLPSCVVRLPMVYGEGDRQRRLTPYLRQLKAGASEIVLGRTHAAWETARGYVANMAHAMALAVENPASAGRTYNAADDRVCTEEQFARAVVAAAGQATPVKVVADDEVPAGQRFPGDPHYPLVLDTTKIRSELGYADVVGFEAGLKATAEWEWRTM